jgi:hypothetical protein
MIPIKLILRIRSSPSIVPAYLQPTSAALTMHHAPCHGTKRLARRSIGTSVIWLAFAVELIVMAAGSDRPWRYCFQHWIDVVIVLLPAVEMLPLFRLLRTPL